MQSDNHEARRYIFARLVWFFVLTLVVLSPLVGYLIKEGVELDRGSWICLLTWAALLAGLAYCLSGIFVWPGGPHSRWRAFRDRKRRNPSEESPAIVSGGESNAADANDTARPVARARSPHGLQVRLITLLIVVAIAPPLLSIIYRLLAEQGKAVAVPLAIVLSAGAIALIFSLYNHITDLQRHRRQPEFHRQVAGRQQDTTSLDSRLSAEKRVEQLEDDLARARLLITSLMEACLRKGVFEPKELREALRDIDKMDGLVDGKLSPGVVRPREPGSE